MADGQSSQLSRPVNAIASDFLASVNHYDQGGVEAVPTHHLHEQMGDPDMEATQAQICSVAMDLVGMLIAGKYSYSPKENELRAWGQELTKKLSKRTQILQCNGATPTTHPESSPSPVSVNISQPIRMVKAKDNVEEDEVPTTKVYHTTRTDQRQMGAGKGRTEGKKISRGRGHQPDNKRLLPIKQMRRSEVGPCQVLQTISFKDQLGTPDLLAVPTGAAFIPAYAPSAPTESDEYAVSMLKSAPAESDGQCILQSDASRPSSSQRAWKAPLVQQNTSGTQYPDQRPPSVAESAEAAAFCLPAEQTRGLGAESRSKAEQRPLTSEELSEAASVTTDGTPSKSGRVQRPLSSQEPN